MKVLLGLLVLFVISGCGSIKFSPRNCRTEAIWGESENGRRGYISSDVQKDKVIEVKSLKSFYVFYDREIKLQEILNANGIKCEDVKNIRVIFKTSWFVKRDVSLKVVLK